MHSSYASHGVVCVRVSAVYILTLAQFFVCGKILMCQGTLNTYDYSPLNLYLVILWILDFKYILLLLVVLYILYEIIVVPQVKYHTVHKYREQKKTRSKQLSQEKLLQTFGRNFR